jgi:hypothetical protein
MWTPRELGWGQEECFGGVLISSVYISSVPSKRDGLVEVGEQLDWSFARGRRFSLAKLL